MVVKYIGNNIMVAKYIDNDIVVLIQEMKI